MSQPGEVWAGDGLRNGLNGRASSLWDNGRDEGGMSKRQRGNCKEGGGGGGVLGVRIRHAIKEESDSSLNVTYCEMHNVLDFWKWCVMKFAV